MPRYEPHTLPIGDIRDEDGDPLVKQAGSVPGYRQLSDTDNAIAWPVNASPEIHQAGPVRLPANFDSSFPIYVDLELSKNADNDALNADIEAYMSKAGDYDNADSNDTAEQAIVAAGTVLTFSLATALLAGPCNLNLVLLIPSSGTNDQDEIYLRSLSVRYALK